MDVARRQELLEQLVAMLEDERTSSATQLVQTNDPWLQFRGLVNVRPPWPATSEFLSLQDELLQGLIAEAGVRENVDYFCGLYVTDKQERD